MDWSSLASGLGLIPNMLFGKNPADEAIKGIQGIPEQMRPYFEPYMKAGQQALPGLQEQYGRLTNDPGGMINQVGSSFQKSPGFDFALKQALQSSGNWERSRGMAGSPEHEFLNMEQATGLANQDYNNWLSKALGMYGQGLGGQQNLYNTGYGASSEFGNTIGSNQMQQALLKYLGQSQKNAASGDILGKVTGALGSLAGFL